MAQNENAIREEIDSLFVKFRENLTNLDTAKLVVDEAYRKAIFIQDSFYLARALDYQGWIESEKGNSFNALEKFYKAISISRAISFDDRTAVILNHIRDTHHHSGNIDSSLYYGFQSLDIRLVLGDSARIAVAYHNLAADYTYLSYKKEATFYFNLALDYLSNSTDSSFISKTYGNLYDLYVQNGETDHRKFIYDKMVEFCQNGCSDRVLINIGIVLGMEEFHQKRYSKALIEMKDALKLAQKLNDQFRIGQAFLVMARIHESIGDDDLFLENIHKAIEVADRNNLATLKSICLTSLTEFYDDKDPMLGLKYLKELKVLNDSIAGTKVFWNVDKIHAEQLEKKNREILGQKEATITQQQRANLYLKISGALGIALLIGLAFNVLLVRRKNQIINEQKDELNIYNEHLLQGLDERDLELQSTREAIERIVSRISHDVRGKVATLKLLSFLAEKESGEEDEYYSKISDTIRDTDVTLEWLTNFSRIKNRDLKLVDIDLAELIDGLLPGVLEEFKGDAGLVSDRSFIFNLLEMIDDRRGIKRIILSAKDSEIVMAVKLKDRWKKKLIQTWTKYLAGPEDINADAEELVVLARAITERLGGKLRIETNSQSRSVDILIELPKVHKLTLDKSISGSSASELH